MARVTTESASEDVPGGDAAAIRAVHRAAFPTAGEAALVDRLREGDRFDPSLSLVARADDGTVVAHALLSLVDVEGEWDGLVLAPVAVVPARQGEGVGSALVRAALARAREAGWDAVFLHGSPAFYPRFGFRPAGELGFENPFETSAEEFMVAVLTDVRLDGGRLGYPPAFDAL